MDPLSLIGGVASAGAIIGAIAKSLQGLHTLRGKFTEANITLGSVISELGTIKTALIQLQAWLDSNHDRTIQRQLAEDLDVSLEGCRECMDILASDVSEMVGDVNQSGAGFFMRARTVWNEDLMKDHQMRLHTQIGALQLLLQAVQMRSLAGQAACIRDPAARRIIQQVKDDTTSIRSRVQPRAGYWKAGKDLSTITDASGRTGDDNSTISCPRLPRLDSQIMATNVYRNHGAAAVAKHMEQRTYGRAEDEQPQSPTSSEERRKPPQPRIDTINLTPPTVTGQGHSPWTPQSTMMDSSFQNHLQHRMPITPVTPNGQASRSPWYKRSPTSPLSSRDRVSPDQRSNGLKAMIRNNFSRASLAPKAPLTPSVSPTSPESSARRNRRKLRRGRTFNHSISLDNDAQVRPLFRAVQLASSRDVAELLDIGEDIEYRHDESGRTALAIAAHCGNFDACQMLLAHGADIQTRDRQLKTPLQLAIEHEHLEVIGLLLEAGAKVNVRDINQSTPLHEAAKSGDDEATTELLAHGADSEAKDTQYQTPIHYAAVDGHLEVMEALLSSSKAIDTPGRDGLSPLMLASAYSKVDMVQLLLRRKASSKLRCAAGWQAIHHASYHGHAEVIDALLGKRTPVDVPTEDGRTPLMLSARCSFSASELLIRRGANLEAQCSQGMRAIHYACEANAKTVLPLLLESKANIEAPGHLSRRPLHIVTAAGSLDLATMLLHKKAVIDARDAGSERPLSIAASRGDVAMLQLLLQYGASMRLHFAVRTSLQDSPLCIACKHGRLAVATELLTRGASARERDEQGWQPLRYAVHYAWPELVELLLANGAALPDLGGMGHNFLLDPYFVLGSDIDEDRKTRVVALLRLAQQGEQMRADEEYARKLATSLEEADAVEMANESNTVGPGTARFSWQETSSTSGNDHGTAGASGSSEQYFSTGRAQTLRPERTLHRKEIPTAIECPDRRSDQGTRVNNALTTRAESAQVSPMRPGSYLFHSANSPCAPSPLSPGYSPNARHGHTSVGVMQMSVAEREQLLGMRCKLCADAEKEMPDLACAACRQKLFKQNWDEQVAEESSSGIRGQATAPPPYRSTGPEQELEVPRVVYEMPDTSHQD